MRKNAFLVVKNQETIFYTSRSCSLLYNVFNLVNFVMLRIQEPPCSNKSTGTEKKCQGLVAKMETIKPAYFQ